MFTILRTLLDTWGPIFGVNVVCLEVVELGQTNQDRSNRVELNSFEESGRGSDNYSKPVLLKRSSSPVSENCRRETCTTGNITVLNSSHHFFPINVFTKTFPSVGNKNETNCQLTPQIIFYVQELKIPWWRVFRVSKIKSSKPHPGSLYVEFKGPVY